MRNSREQNLKVRLGKEDSANIAIEKMGRIQLHTCVQPPLMCGMLAGRKKYFPSNVSKHTVRDNVIIIRTKQEKKYPNTSTVQPA